VARKATPANARLRRAGARHCSFVGELAALDKEAANLLHAAVDNAHDL
jgi:hypothetical protein